jgi:hypothetical protein
VLDERRVAFDADDARALPRDWQRKVSETAEKIADSLAVARASNVIAAVPARG